MRVCLVHRNLHGIAGTAIGTLYTGLAVRLRGPWHDICVVTQDGDYPLDLPGVRRFTLPRTGDLHSHRRAVAEVLRAWRPDVVDCALQDAEILEYALQPRGQRAVTVVRAAPSTQRSGADTVADQASTAELVNAEHALVLAADVVLAVSDIAAQDLARAYDIPLPHVVLPGIDRARCHPGAVLPPLSAYGLTLDPNGDVHDRIPVSALAAADELPAPWDNATSATLQLYYSLTRRLAARS
jgi:D-inositol-3-phosphate glycosyltransferase